MPNNLAQDPLVLDTAHASNVVLQGNVYVWGIKVIGNAGAAVVTMQKKDTATVWFEGRAPAGDERWTPLAVRTPGDIILTVATAAIVLVYLGTEHRG